jgi:predicted TIM-barrel fold metal-dependent hydrolase
MDIATTPYQIFDCDTHILEQPDAFSRFIDPKFRDRAVQFEPGHPNDARIGDLKLDSDTGEMPINTTMRPGSLRDYYAALVAGTLKADYDYMPVQDWHMHREPRIKLMDEQNMEGAIIFPNIALFLDGHVADDDVAHANMHAFNEWFDEEWGFNYKERIYAGPFISFRNLERGVAEVEWALKRGARVFGMMTGHAFGRSPADPYFDPIWSRLNEANAVVCYHLTDSGYNRELSGNWSERPDAKFFTQSAWQWMNCYCDRAMMDTLSSLIYGNLFGRFPNLKVMSVEHGIEWFPYFVKRLDKMRGMGRGGQWMGGPLKERPSEIIKRHVAITPFPEDDVAAVAEALGGVDSIALGSDFPHAEGMAQPGHFTERLGSFSDSDVRKIMRDNGRRFLPV